MVEENKDPVMAGALTEQIEKSASSNVDQRLIRVPSLSSQIIRYSKGVPRSIDRVDPTLRRTMKGCLDGELPWPVYLFGPVGSGKTSAALCVVDHVNGSLYTGVADWCDQLDRARNMDSGVFGLWERASESSLTVLDELGTRERPSDARWEVVLRFSDRREWKPAIYVSNLTPEEFRTFYGERIYDRVRCGTVCELGGSSRR